MHNHEHTLTTCRHAHANTHTHTQHTHTHTQVTSERLFHNLFSKHRPPKVRTNSSGRTMYSLEFQTKAELDNFLWKGEDNTWSFRSYGRFHEAETLSMVHDTSETLGGAKGLPTRVNFFIRHLPQCERTGTATRARAH